MFDPIEVGCEDPDNAIRWIYDAFGDCIYTQWDSVAFTFGLVSLALFTVAMFPQFIKTYRRKSISGLSPSFLLIWLFGDIANFVGALWTDQLPIILWTGAYFILIDILIFSQWLWYAVIRPKIKMQREESRDTLVDDNDDVDGSCGKAGGDCCCATRQSTSVTPLIGASHSNNNANSGKTNNVALISTLTIMSLCMRVQSAAIYSDTMPLHVQSSSDSPADTKMIIGSIMAWVSGLLYFWSRVPQIFTNMRLKTVEGLSVSLFVITISANTLFGLSILIRVVEAGSVNGKFWSSTLPYVVGSMGTLVFDAIIIYQSYIHRNGYQELVNISEDPEKRVCNCKSKQI
ncbi:hypothetical protein MP228_008782 [Amoeboaphelidium protococcarum]|nr:hypothetical protein MP228_008782 [Amoeboaphelidium protococcarum]